MTAKLDLIPVIADFAANVLASDKTGHDFTHIKRVVKASQAMLIHEPTANEFIVLAAAYLHDTYDDKLFAQPELAKQDVVAFLTAKQITLAEQQQIFTIIDNMSWSKQLSTSAEALDINGQIVQDADRLDAIGAIAIARVFVYGGAHGHVLYDPLLKPRTQMTKAEYRDDKTGTMINHFYEKLLLLVNSLHTDYARQVGAKRQRIMEQYLHDFYTEWDGLDL